MTARAPYGCRCGCSSTTASACCRAASRRASARARPSPATCSGRQPRRRPGQKGAGGKDQGGIELMLEFKVDDIVDWLWEDLALPNLKPRAGATRGIGMEARRLGPARSALAAGSPPLAQGIGQAARARCLTRPRSRTRTCGTASSRAAANPRCGRPCSSCSMCRAACRTATGSWPRRSSSGWRPGLKREYQALDIVFVAHTTEAWEFSEPDFFKVTGTGGTVASVGLAKVQEIMEAALRSVDLQRLPVLRLRRRQRRG